MKTAEFLNLLKDYLEIENTEITVDTEFSSLAEFNSLGKLSVISLIDEYFNKTIAIKELNNLVKIKDLINIIGKDKFED